MKLKRIKVLSLAKFQAVLMLYVGLCAGILYSFGGFFYDLFTIGLNWGTLLAFGALVGMPAIFAVFGFVLGIIEAIVFNFFARWFGGIELDL
ncbi:MAG: hypothetical protein HKN25_16355 [Pyrinomonadaceae bacterium]|nr:hypothetical protein [Pyrinomonadaceae bacterium]